ncbi:unnamed protein product [Discula destructiva]
MASRWNCRVNSSIHIESKIVSLGRRLTHEWPLLWRQAERHCYTTPPNTLYYTALLTGNAAMKISVCSAEKQQHFGGAQQPHVNIVRMSDSNRHVQSL